MDALTAVETALTQANEPLHYREITRRILEQGLWQTEGHTPEATINARLAVDIQRGGAQSHFQRTAAGIFALRAWGLSEVKPRGARGKTPPTKEAQLDGPTNEAKPGQTPAPKPSVKLSFADAAEAVLEQLGHNKPMHYRTITEKILELGLVNTKGQTPEATLYAQVLTENKRRTRLGEPPRFVMHGKGYVGLTKWVTGGLAFQIEQHNDAVRKKLHAQLFSIHPNDFEGLMVELLAALGFEDVTLTPASGDGGIDVRGTLVVGDVIRTRMAVQVKRWRRNVQAPIVQQVRGSLGTHEQGLIITTSDFSKGAQEEAERANAVPVALMNGEQLVKLLVENDIGVRRTQYDLIELGEDE